MASTPVTQPREVPSPPKGTAAGKANGDGSLEKVIEAFIALWPSVDEPDNRPGHVRAETPPYLAAAYRHGDLTTRPSGRFVVQDVVVARADGWAEAPVLLRDSADAATDPYPFVARFVQAPGQRWRLATVDPLCPSCFGSGLIDSNRRLCGTCGGTGWGTGKVDYVTGEGTAPAAVAAASVVLPKSR